MQLLCKVLQGFEQLSRASCGTVGCSCLHADAAMHRIRREAAIHRLTCGSNSGLVRFDTQEGPKRWRHEGRQVEHGAGNSSH